MPYVQADRAVLRTVFDEDHEILSLGGKYTAQAKVVANRTPSIAEPADWDSDPMADMIAGGCYLALDPASGVPAVEIRDGADSDWVGAGSAVLPGVCARSVLVTPAGTWCPPMRKPLVFPPMARYIGNATVAATTAALYPIGGWVANNDSAYLEWKVNLTASRHPVAFAGTGQLKYRLLKEIREASHADPATTKTCHSPLMRYAPDRPAAASAGVWAMWWQAYASAQLGNVLYYINADDGDAVNSGGGTVTLAVAAYSTSSACGITWVRFALGGTCTAAVDGLLPHPSEGGIFPA